MPRRDRLESLCAELDPPDFLVLRDTIGLEPLAQWSTPARYAPKETYSLYSCAQLNAASSAS